MATNIYTSMKETIKCIFAGLGATLGIILLIPVVLILLLLLVFLAMQTTFGANLWLSVTGAGYRIPETSSYFSFDCTRMNDGSGEWCRYGEDKVFYYSYDGFGEDNFGAFPKKKISECKGFDPKNDETWCKEFAQKVGYLWSPRN